MINKIGFTICILCVMVLSVTIAFMSNRVNTLEDKYSYLYEKWSKELQNLRRLDAKIAINEMDDLSRDEYVNARLDLIAGVICDELMPARGFTKEQFERLHRQLVRGEK